jgi:hypothetical protein
MSFQIWNFSLRAKAADILSSSSKPRSSCGFRVDWMRDKRHYFRIAHLRTNNFWPSERMFDVPPSVCCSAQCSTAAAHTHPSTACAGSALVWKKHKPQVHSRSFPLSRAIKIHPLGKQTRGGGGGGWTRAPQPQPLFAKHRPRERGKKVKSAARCWTRAAINKKSGELMI